MSSRLLRHSSVDRGLTIVGYRGEVEGGEVEGADKYRDKASVLELWEVGRQRYWQVQEIVMSRNAIGRAGDAQKREQGERTEGTSSYTRRIGTSEETGRRASVRWRIQLAVAAGLFMFELPALLSNQGSFRRQDGDGTRCSIPPCTRALTRSKG
eukprot:3338752-Pleurochrysis_carterae.AAC.2